jgi:hypothetical protein
MEKLYYIKQNRVKRSPEANAIAIFFTAILTGIICYAFWHMMFTAIEGWLR